MHEQLIRTYSELMQSLSTLPGDIASQQAQLLDLEREARALAQAIETGEHGFIADAGGWKALGANDKERELRLAEFGRTNTAAFHLARQKRERESAIDATRQVIAALERRYGAVCYQVRLHAALLQYLGQAGAPLPAAPSQAIAPTALRSDVNFYSTNGNVSADDAALIGL